VPASEFFSDAGIEPGSDQEGRRDVRDDASRPEMSDQPNVANKLAINQSKLDNLTAAQRAALDVAASS
jgi:hypothetical protein